MRAISTCLALLAAATVLAGNGKRAGEEMKAIGKKVSRIRQNRQQNRLTLGRAARTHGAPSRWALHAKGSRRHDVAFCPRFQDRLGTAHARASAGFAGRIRPRPRRDDTRTPAACRRNKITLF